VAHTHQQQAAAVCLSLSPASVPHSLCDKHGHACYRPRRCAPRRCRFACWTSAACACSRLCWRSLRHSRSTSGEPPGSRRARAALGCRKKGAPDAWHTLVLCCAWPAIARVATNTHPHSHTHPLTQQVRQRVPVQLVRLAHLSHAAWRGGAAAAGRRDAAAHAAVIWAAGHGPVQGARHARRHGAAARTCRWAT
jgi:hypothetical protein